MKRAALVAIALVCATSTAQATEFDQAARGYLHNESVKRADAPEFMDAPRSQHGQTKAYKSAEAVVTGRTAAPIAKVKIGDACQRYQTHVLFTRTDPKSGDKLGALTVCLSASSFT